MHRKILTPWVARVAAIAISAFCVPLANAQDALTITDWNIENIGGDGRGFAGGFGRGNLPQRSDAQLADIAALITGTLGSDIVAFQEASITRINDDGDSRNRALDIVVDELGSGWQYWLPEVDNIPGGHDNLFTGYMWNSNRVRAVRLFEMDVPNLSLGGDRLFARKPTVAYFEALRNGQGTNDFVIVNMHMKSGQSFDENHLIAMTMTEFRLTRELRRERVKESDRIILGDFNDNPFARTSSGRQKFSAALYEHMAFRGYVDFVNAATEFTRMNQNLDSIIDHILVNRSAKRHIPQDHAEKVTPGNSSTFAEWRRTFSDHFPLSFEIKVATSDDDVDF